MPHQGVCRPALCFLVPHRWSACLKWWLRVEPRASYMPSTCAVIEPHPTQVCLTLCLYLYVCVCICLFFSVCICICLSVCLYGFSALYLCFTSLFCSGFKSAIRTSLGSLAGSQRLFFPSPLLPSPLSATSHPCSLFFSDAACHIRA